jgi:hypothetical protein
MEGLGKTSRPGFFTPKKQPRYPLNRRLVGPQSWFVRFGEKYFASVGIRIPDRLARILVTYRLSYQLIYTFYCITLKDINREENAHNQSKSGQLWTGRNKSVRHS